jgi:hypothetical protein
VFRKMASFLLSSKKASASSLESNHFLFSILII